MTKPRIIGLTGSIGMGKSVAAIDLRRLGVPVHDSDAAVHALTRPGGEAVSAIAEAFPEIVSNGVIDRQALGAKVFGDDAAMRRLEAILHPRVRARTRNFLARHARWRTPLVVLDIPLLFETGGEARCDAIAVVTAPEFLQRQRVLRRPGMTEDKFENILARQVPDREKRRWADFVVRTGLGRYHSLRQLREVATMARSYPARAWPAAWPPERPSESR